MELLDRLPGLPAAIVDLDAFDANLRAIGRLASASGSAKRVRLATKSLRVPALIERALRAGPPFRGLMCYSAQEASMLAARGLDDFLIAYPTLQERDLLAIRETSGAGKVVRLVVDSDEQVSALEEFARRKGVFAGGRGLGLVIDLDVSLRLARGGLHLGARRSPLRDFSRIFELVSRIQAVPGLRFSGFMAYEAQVAGLPDRNPFTRARNPVAHWIRRRSAREVARFREALARECRARGVEIELFNGGGTGSLRTACAEPALTEVAAGSGLFAPHLFDYYSDIRFEPACYFALQAVREPVRGLVTCQGGGYVASGQAGRDRLPLPVSPAGARLLDAEGAGEVQTPLRLPSGTRVRLGDPVLFRHAKAGELMERFNEVFLVSGGRIVGREPTYRGLGRCFF